MTLWSFDGTTQPLLDRMVRGNGLVVLVGEAPGAPGYPEPLPPCSRVGRKLANLANLSEERYARAFDRVNVFDRPMQGWDAREAQDRARRIIDLVRHRRVVLLGRRVARAFRISAEWFEEVRCWNTEWYVMPHPSGRNLWYNDPRNTKEAREFLSDLVTRSLRQARNASPAFRRTRYVS